MRRPSHSSPGDPRIDSDIFVSQNNPNDVAPGSPPAVRKHAELPELALCRVRRYAGHEVNAARQ